jgi:spermidine synthase
MISKTYQDSKLAISFILSISAFVAFCSILYELIIAQCLSIVLGGSIIRYSFTIGSYLFCLGLGSLCIYFSQGDLSFKRFFYVECCLCVLGFLGPFWIFFTDFFFTFLLKSYENLSLDYLKLILMHMPIAAIGVLSGCEIPLLIQQAEQIQKKNIINKIVGVDFIFTFLGAILFPLFFLEQFDIIKIACLVSLLNGVVALYYFATLRVFVNNYAWLRFFIILFVIVLSCCFYSENICFFLSKLLFVR